ncbi:farnesyl cysteine-carboxyl methyltransferase [Rhodotorula kratochvilovae]
MSVDMSPPQSPFEPRPSPPSPPASSSSAPGKDDEPPSSSGPTQARPMPVEWPLTSFSSTPHNVACIAFLLGATCAVGAVLLASNAAHWFVWAPGALRAHAQELPRGVWYAATHSPQLGLYLAAWSFFHLAEFVVTSMWNPGKLSVSSYLLDNGNLYHVAHVGGILEHILEDAYLPEEYRRWKHAGGVFLVGVALIAGGQVLRSYAMISASSNFSHLLAYSKRPGHRLVKEGVYAWSRHPSYAGFYWWAFGTQVMLGNPICGLAFLALLQWFFSARIKIEEQYLVRFFGKEYEDYRREVPSRILFVP